MSVALVELSGNIVLGDVMVKIGQAEEGEIEKNEMECDGCD